MNHLATRETIKQNMEAFELMLLSSSEAITEFKDDTKHYVTGGLYARELLIPAGTIISSARHKRDHICIISQGIIDVVWEGGAKRIEAPYTFKSGPGKRLLKAITDTVWIAIYSTDETDIDKIESSCVEGL